MADKKISELDAITGAATAADDFFIVVDSSGSATKKISREELNNAIERDVLSTVDIDGGTIDGTTIGGSSAAAGTFTDLTVTGTVTGITQATGNELENVVEDTTPQLGGNLDTNGNDINFGDNDKAIFGAGSDLQIYHDGSDSYINDVGTGNFRLKTNGLALQILDSSDLDLANFNNNGSVYLKHVDTGVSTTRLQTTSTGIDVTGTVTADGLTVDGNILVSGSAGGSRYIIVDDNASYTGTLNLQAGGGSAGFGGGLVMYGHSHATYPGSVWIGSSTSSGGSIMFGQGGIGPGTERMRLTENGRLGIGTASPSHLIDGRLSGTSSGEILAVGNTGSGVFGGIAISDGGTYPVRHWGSSLEFYTGNSTYSSASEAMRLDSSGNLLVGKTANSIAGAGVVIRGGGELFSTRAGDVAGFNRLTTDGPIVQFYKDGSVVGIISAYAGNIIAGSGDTGIFFYDDDDVLRPVSPTTRGTRDNAIDIGSSGARFKDLYLSGTASVGTAVATTDTDTTNTGSVTLDFGANQNFVLTLTGNVTLANPTTEQVGQSGFIVFIQDATGGRTVSLGTDYETAGGSGLTLSSAASTTDIVPYVVAASGRILLGAPQLNFS